MNYKKGKTYDEIQMGDSASFSKTITEADIILFAGISGDFNPLHMNEEYAKTTDFKTRIAHGGLAASLLAPVLGNQLPGLGTVALETITKFRKPTYIGDTITCTVEVTSKNQRMKSVTMKVIWTNQKNEVICKGECKVIPPT
ncbi:MAG: MaoC family dehydratase [Leptospira sp.]|jgi:3-hydroxybutyryl-CoA dehydratase|nr:MaoC family dehydratase [Leptospira sp.]NCS95078.1 MaoC family dehydratase [Leptospira sp.]